MGEVIGLPGATQDSFLDRREAQLKKEALNKAEPGHWGWEHLIRVQNLDGSDEASEAAEESGKASKRQDELIKLIQEQFGTELDLPEKWTECCKRLYDQVEDLRSRSPLFEEYYWLCRQMNFQRAEEVRQRGLRVVS